MVLKRQTPKLRRHLFIDLDNTRERGCNDLKWNTELVDLFERMDLVHKHLTTGNLFVRALHSKESFLDPLRRDSNEYMDVVSKVKLSLHNEITALKNEMPSSSINALSLQESRVQKPGEPISVYLAPAASSRSLEYRAVRSVLDSLGESVCKVFGDSDPADKVLPENFERITQSLRSLPSLDILVQLIGQDKTKLIDPATPALREFDKLLLDERFEAVSSKLNLSEVDAVRNRLFVWDTMIDRSHHSQSELDLIRYCTSLGTTIFQNLDISDFCGRSETQDSRNLQCSSRCSFKSSQLHSTTIKQWRNQMVDLCIFI